MGASVGAGLFISPFAETIVEKFHSFNVIFVSTMILGGRFMVSSVWLASPPYQIFILSLCDIFNYNLFWVSCVKYAFKIAPKAYVATVTSIIGAIQWLLCKTLLQCFYHSIINFVLFLSLWIRWVCWWASFKHRSHSNRPLFWHWSICYCYWVLYHHTLSHTHKKI